MSNNHPKHSRNFTPQPINKHHRPTNPSRPRFDVTSKSTPARPASAQTREPDANATFKRPHPAISSSSTAQPDPPVSTKEAPKSGSSNPYPISLNTFPKLPKFKRLSEPKNEEKRLPGLPSSAATAPAAANLFKLPPNRGSRPLDVPRRPPAFPRKPQQQQQQRQPPSSARPGWHGNRFPTHKSRPEEEEVPDKSPKKKTRTVRRKKGAAVSTEPTKTRRTGQSAGNGQTAGGISLAEDVCEDTDDELYRVPPTSSSSQSKIPSSNPASSNQFPAKSIEDDRVPTITPSLNKMVISSGPIPGFSLFLPRPVSESTPIPGLSLSSDQRVIEDSATLPMRSAFPPNKTVIENTATNKIDETTSVTTRETPPIKMVVEQAAAPVPVCATSPEKVAIEKRAPSPAPVLSAVKSVIEKPAPVPETARSPTKTAGPLPETARSPTKIIIKTTAPLPLPETTRSPTKIIIKSAAPLPSKSPAHPAVSQQTLASPFKNTKQASKGPKPGAVKPSQDRHDTSSLSSLSSEPEPESSSSEDDSDSSDSEDSSAEASSRSFHAVHWKPPSPTLEEENKLFLDPVEGLETFHHPQPVQTSEEARMSPPPVPEVLMDDASELGEDVCLEYTDFGASHEMGVPVTWSESDYDEGEESEGTDEFAEFLLMEAGDDNMIEIDKLVQDSVEPHSSDTESFEYDGLFSDSSVSFMLIQDDEPTTTQGTEEATVDEGEEGSDEGSDGDTTDSLDEDDHSGLVRFGIEVDDDEAEEDDATFFDLPPDSALGSVLTNFELSGDVEFFVLPEEPDPSQQSISPACLLPPVEPVSTAPVPGTIAEAASMGSIQLPIMGSFAVGSGAGRTIIDDQALPPPSPFSGTKVVRYNRFKKLRDRSCAGDSELSSLGTPKPDSQTGSLAPHPAELSAAEDDFDFTAFIREDDDGDQEVGAGAAGCGDVAMEDLSRWRRVPMTAFRRNMMSASCSGWATEPALDGAIIQPTRHTTAGHTLSLVQEKKQHAKTLLMSPSSRHKRRRRRRSSKQSVGTMGGGEDRTELTGHEQGGLIDKGFDTPLFKSVIEMGGNDMPMLNLMDGIEGLPIE